MSHLQMLTGTGSPLLLFMKGCNKRSLSFTLAEHIPKGCSSHVAQLGRVVQLTLSPIDQDQAACAAMHQLCNAGKETQLSLLFVGQAGRKVLDWSHLLFSGNAPPPRRLLREPSQCLHCTSRKTGIS